MAAVTPVGERTLKFNDQIIAQENGYFCGPASTQIALSCQGIWESESELARQLQTDTGGTDWIGLFPPVLNKYMPGGKYVFAEIPDDPPTDEQKTKLWNAIRGSIDAGYAVIGNIVAPPGNYPVAVKNSPTLSYRSGTYFHYVSFVGYDDSYPGGAVKWADPGFNPFWSWVSLEQTASLIAQKGYAYSTAPSIAPDVTAPPSLEGVSSVSLSSEQDRMLREIWGALFNRVPSTSHYAAASDTHMTKDLIRYTDGHMHDVWVEHRALLGDKRAIDWVYAKMQEGDAWAQHVWSLIDPKYLENPIG